MKNLAKKSLAVFMCMLLCMIEIPFGPLTVSAETTTTGTLGDLSYSVTDGKVTITKCAGTATTVEIPAEIESYPVVYIDSSSFSFQDSLTSITIPSSVVNIGKCAFLGCRRLTSITVDKNNANYCDVDGLLFNKNKTELIQYAIGKADTGYITPNYVTSIGDGAFAYCTKLNSIIISNSVISIGDTVFENCDILTSIIIPNSVTDIGNCVFNSCNSLTSITIPNSVMSIGHGTFMDCSSLTSITVDKNNPNYCDVDGVLFNKNKTELIQYTTGKTEKSYIIPNSVENILDSAFISCSNLTSVTIPNSVISIRDWTFMDCTELTSVIIPNSVTSIGMWSFSYCTSLTSVTIPDSVTSIGQDAFMSCTSLNIYCSYGSVAETYAKNNNISFKLIGDADGNNKVDAVDAALTLKYFTLSMSGKTMSTTFNNGAADVDGSGKVDAVDAAYILKYFTKNMSHSFTWSDIIGK